jgi:hypothetical protein
MTVEEGYPYAWALFNPHSPMDRKATPMWGSTLDAWQRGTDRDGQTMSFTWSPGFANQPHEGNVASRLS